jgi:uncharacterized membrane protein YeaQ/YmgE (transglycosylase-associated protein family)
MLLGLVAGFLASKIVNKTGEGVVLDIALGVVGALAGGWLFKQFGQPGVTGLDPWSLLVAVVARRALREVRARPYHAATCRGAGSRKMAQNTDGISI